MQLMVCEVNKGIARWECNDYFCVCVGIQTQDYWQREIF